MLEIWDGAKSTRGILEGYINKVEPAFKDIVPVELMPII